MNSSSPDYPSLYQSKCLELEALHQNYLELRQVHEESEQIMNDLEQQSKQLRHKNDKLAHQLAEIKDRNRNNMAVAEREIQLAHRDRQEFKRRFGDFEKKVIELQIVNQQLENKLRSAMNENSLMNSKRRKTLVKIRQAYAKLIQKGQLEDQQRGKSRVSLEIKLSVKDVNGKGSSNSSKSADLATQIKNNLESILTEEEQQAQNDSNESGSDEQSQAGHKNNQTSSENKINSNDAEEIEVRIPSQTKVTFKQKPNQQMVQNQIVRGQQTGQNNLRQSQRSSTTGIQGTTLYSNYGNNLHPHQSQHDSKPFRDAIAAMKQKLKQVDSKKMEIKLLAMQ